MPTPGESYKGRHILAGIGATAAMALTYLAIIILSQGSEHVRQQVESLWYWMVPLLLGFGIQAGLFSYIRQGVRRRKKSATASVATSGGITGGSMLACCAHHVSDVAPAIVTAGAAVFLARYQHIFLLAGTVSNVVGIVIMLDAIKCMNMPGARALGKWNMAIIKKLTIGIGAAVVAAVALTEFLSRT